MSLLSAFTGAPAATPEGQVSDARRLLGNKPREAALSAIGVLRNTHCREQTFAEAARILAEALQAEGNPRGALTATWYLNDPQREQRLVPDVPPIERALTLARWASFDRNPDHFESAAQELEQAGLTARAAVYHEKGQQPKAARALWSRLAKELDSHNNEPYAAGLAYFNLARLTSTSTREGRDASIAAVQRLEEAADRFEAIGQRERAFDCFHTLIAIGRESKTFEHVLEGAVNAIRILCEDNLRYHALRLWEHALGLAERAEEYSAAATLAREMGIYARKQGLGGVYSRAVLRQAGFWQQAGAHVLARGGSTELAENAYLASIHAYAEGNQYGKIGSLFKQLSELDIDASRQRHYQRSSRRYGSVSDTRLDLADDRSLGRHVEPPDVWIDDLVEWETGNDVAIVCADLLLDPEEPSDSIVRRAALVSRLLALELEDGDSTDSEQQALLADYLAPLDLYTVLAPLEHLYGSDDKAVRQAVIRTLSRFCYKRTFVTVERALGDPSSSVVKEAVSALDRLRFDHALEPLARIYRTTRNKNARVAALRTIARLDVQEAAELVLGVLDHGGESERKAAISVLTQSRGQRFVETARAAHADASPRLQEAIDEVFSKRGLRV